MNRREFIKVTAAVATVALSPEMAAFAQGDADEAFLNELRALTDRLSGIQPVDGDYVCFVSPQQEEDLRRAVARNEWRDAYRRWRAAGRPGSDAPRMVLSWIGQPPRGELTSWQGFRLIEQAIVA